MKASTGIGIVVACAGLALGGIMEGTNLAAILNIPAILIVVGGTLGVSIAAVGMEKMKAVPALYKRVLNAEPQDLNGRVDELVGLAERARKDGLLALDEELSTIEDPFTRKGMQLVVDGTDPEVVRGILEAEIDSMQTRHAGHANTFKQAGGFAPTMGILGTVMGLVHVLENLDRPETLGPSISGAFIATLLGVGIANVVFLPVANRLIELSADEAGLRWLTLDGIMAIQAGENPRIVRDKLLSLVPPAGRGGEAEADDAGASAPLAEAA